MSEMAVMALPVLGEFLKRVAPRSSQKPAPGTFYRHLRPIAVVGLLLGSLPLTGACGVDGRKLGHRWFGPRVAWDVLVFALAVGGYACVLLLGRTHVHGHVLGDVLAWVFVAHGCAQFLLCHWTAQELPPLLSELEEAYQRHGVHGRLQRTLRRYGICMFLAMLLIVAYSALVGFLNFQKLDTTLLHRLVATPAYMLLTMPITTPLVLYSFLALSMDALFGDARQCLEDALCPAPGHLVDDLRLGDERLWHATLSELTARLEACFGVHFLVNVALIQTEMIIEMYLFFLQNKSTDMILLSYIVYDVTLVVLVTNLTAKLTVQASKVLDGLRAVPSSKLTARGQFEVQMFITQIIARPVQISAAGYFIVEKSLLTSILSSVATYLIVMIQFSPFFHGLTY